MKNQRTPMRRNDLVYLTVFLCCLLLGLGGFATIVPTLLRGHLPSTDAQPASRVGAMRVSDVAPRA
ncbi:MAG: hypothetical protein ACPGZP_09680 [Panacagrimonas sp.]